MTIEYLIFEDVLDLVADLGCVVRDPGLLESALARPRASVFGEDAYQAIDLKAAALLQSLVKNPALVDGNKRIGWAATLLFLNINGYTSRLTQPEAASMVIQVAGSDVQVGLIAAELVVVEG